MAVCEAAMLSSKWNYRFGEREKTKFGIDSDEEVRSNVRKGCQTRVNLRIIGFACRNTVSLTFVDSSGPSRSTRLESFKTDLRVGRCMMIFKRQPSSMEYLTISLAMMHSLHPIPIFKFILILAKTFWLRSIEVRFQMQNRTMHHLNPMCVGNIIKPREAKSAPSVEFQSDPDSLWTLALTTPDGHFTDESKEYLHWMVANIKGSDISSGEELCNYLQPFPPFGTGYFRYIFVLYKQVWRLVEILCCSWTGNSRFRHLRLIWVKRRDQQIATVWRSELFQQGSSLKSTKSLWFHLVWLFFKQTGIQV